MVDRLAELGALQYAAANTATASVNPSRIAASGYIHAMYAEYVTWSLANPGVNPSRLSAKGRIFGYFYDNATFSPLSLFASGEQGAWYDPSDLTTMFQDAAGTTPVTADGQPVGKILDKSGRGNHATQATAASRPLYKTDGTYHWLWFDGVDDFLVTASNIGISAPPLSSFSGVLAADVTKNQCCWSNGLYIDGINISKQRFTTVGTLDYYQTTPTLLSGSKYVFSKVFDTGFDCKFRTNGANEELVFGVADAGAAQDVLIIGAYSGGFYFYGDLFSLIICDAQCSVAEIAAAEQFVAAKTGVFF